MQLEVVRVDLRFRETWADDYFHRLSLFASVELYERMLIEA
jgi:hypothetical protein